MFAQTPSPTELGAWMICLAAVISMALNGSKLLDRWRGKPPAEQLEMSADLLAKRIDVLEHSQDRSKADQEDRRRAIYGEIGKMRDSMNHKIEQTRLELKQDIESTRRELSEKLDTTTDRVIVTLKNTGAI